MARAICEWSCADGLHGSSSTSPHDAHRASEHAVADHQHSGDSHPVANHDHARTDDGGARVGEATCCQVAIAIVPLCCAHTDSHTVSIAAAKIALEPSAVPPAAFELWDLLVFEVSPAPVSAVARPPVPLSLRTPLRV